MNEDSRPLFLPPLRIPGQGRQRLRFHQMMKVMGVRFKSKDDAAGEFSKKANAQPKVSLSTTDNKCGGGKKSG